MKIKHLLWWMLSEDEKTVMIRSEIILQIFGKVIPLSERKFELQANYCGRDDKERQVNPLGVTHSLE